jgi:hypothetical protein
MPGTQLVAGQVRETGVYTSRAIPGGQKARVRMIFDARIPGGAGVTCAASGIDEGDEWTPLTFVSGKPVDEGFIEHTYDLDSLDEEMIRVCLTLSGTSAARPVVRNLRVIIT